MVKEVRAPTLEGPGQLYVSLSFKLSRGDLVAWEKCYGIPFLACIH